MCCPLLDIELHRWGIFGHLTQRELDLSLKTKSTPSQSRVTDRKKVLGLLGKVIKTLELGFSVWSRTRLKTMDVRERPGPTPTCHLGKQHETRLLKVTGLTKSRVKDLSCQDGGPPGQRGFVCPRSSTEVRTRDTTRGLRPLVSTGYLRNSSRKFVVNEYSSKM